MVEVRSVLTIVANTALYTWGGHVEVFWQYVVNAYDPFDPMLPFCVAGANAS